MIEYIDQEKCVGCGTCTKTCPLDVFRIDPRQPELAPCMAACPAGIDIRTDHALVQQGKVLEALDNLKKAQPFPAITGRVCFHPCEGACSRKEVDAAVNINGLEQFLGDVDLACDKTVPATRRHISRVAVVGSGPAGLACAYFLADMGYAVSVFEASPEPGGMLRYGIPAYRLPDAVVRAQVAKLEAMGVRFRCNTKVGRGVDLSLDDLLDDGFNAVFLALGTTTSRKLALPGADLSGVYWGLEFLRAVRSGEAPRLRGKVLVVGGGDVAVDAAISAKRLGAAQVAMACLEPEGGLPAYAHNLADAEREGITFHCSLGPARILEKDGRVGGVEFTSCLSVCDASGAFNPTFDEACVLAIEADAVVFAIGQATELDGFAGELDMARGRIIADPVTCATSRWGVFAAGDAVTGPASVVRAIAGGREAAFSIDRMLKGAEIRAGRDRPRPELPKERLPGKDILPQLRNERRLLAPHAAPGFAESRAGFDLHEAFAEANRCLTCGSKAYVAYDDDCMTCFSCELRCPSGAINVHPFKERIPRTLEMLFMPAGRTVP